MKSIRLFAAVAAAAFVAFAGTSTASAAKVPCAILKTYFETGDVPTEEQFKDLIDSYIHQVDDGVTVFAIGVNGTTGNAGRKADDDVIDITLSYAPNTLGAPKPAMAPEFAGQYGYLPLQLEDNLGQIHFGYLQLSMESPLVNDPPGIYVDYLVYESVAGAPITVAAVPEPMSLGVLGAASLLMMLRRRR